MFENFMTPCLIPLTKLLECSGTTKNKSIRDHAQTLYPSIMLNKSAKKITEVCWKMLVTMMFVGIRRKINSTQLSINEHTNRKYVFIPHFNFFSITVMSITDVTIAIIVTILSLVRLHWKLSTVTMFITRSACETMKNNMKFWMRIMTMSMFLSALRRLSSFFDSTSGFVVLVLSKNNKKANCLTFDNFLLRKCTVCFLIYFIMCIDVWKTNENVCCDI